MSENNKLVTKQKSEIPKLADLTQNVELAWKTDSLNFLLTQQPPADWVKEHPYIRGYKYLPIDKVEHLLRKIFKSYKIEVIKTGMLMNAVEVTVRVHYVDPITGDWLFQDGVAAQELQTQKDSGNLKLDMSNVNRGAVTMALPIAKTMAVKDACDHFGDLFGANLNRKDVLSFMPDKNLDVDSQLEELKELYELKKQAIPLDQLPHVKRVIEDKETKSYKKTFNYLTKL